MSGEDEQPKGQLVHLIHGIRTHAAWQNRVTQLLESAEGVEVCATRYGQFDLLSFLLPGPTRRPPIDRTLDDLMDSIKRAEASNRKLTVIAHSYGTHAIHEILDAHSAIEIDNLILCGAIKGQECAWKKIRKTSIKGALINDYGTKDVWPAIAASITWGYGSGGTYGIGMPFEDRRHPFRHSDFFSDAFVEQYWLPFFAEGKIVPANYEPEPTHPWWFPILDLPWRWIITTVIAVALVTAAYAALTPKGDAPAETTTQGPAEPVVPNEDPLNAFLASASLSTPISQFDLRLSMGKVTAFAIENEQLLAKAYTPISKRNLIVAYETDLPEAVGYIGGGADTRIIGLNVGQQGGKSRDSTADMSFDEVYGYCRNGRLRVPGTSSFGRIYLSGCYYGRPGSYQSYGFIYRIPDTDYGDDCQLDFPKLQNQGLPMRDVEELVASCSFFTSTAIGYATALDSDPPPQLIENMLWTLSTDPNFQSE